MKHCLVILSLVFLIPFGGFAQVSKYFEKGTSGFDISAGFLSNDDMSGFLFFGGYSIESLIDLGLTVGRLSANLENTTDDLYATAIAPHIGIHVLKQTQDIPVSFFLSGTYESDSFSGDVLDDLGWEMTGSGYGFGALLYGVVSSNQNVAIVPSTGVSYTKAKVKLEDIFGNSITEEEDDVSFSIGLGFGFTLHSDQILYLDPNVSFNNQNTTFGISIGMSLPTHKRYINKQENRGSKQEDINYLLKDNKSTYLEIVNIRKSYLLVYISKSTLMRLGETYKIVRLRNANNPESGYYEIGTAEVLKLKENKVAMEYNLFDSSDELTTKDKIEFVY